MPELVFRVVMVVKAASCTGVGVYIREERSWDLRTGPVEHFPHIHGLDGGGCVSGGTGSVNGGSSLVSCILEKEEAIVSTSSTRGCFGCGRCSTIKLIISAFSRR